MIVNSETIKDSMTMEEVLSHLGYQLNRQNRTSCPIHGGDDANFSVKGSYGTCFSQCGGKSWSAIDLLMEVKNLTYPEALEWIAEKGNVIIEYTDNTNRPQQLEEARSEREKYKRLVEANEAALQMYEGDLDLLDDQHYDFDGRSWLGSTVKAFRICATPNRNLLVDNMNGYQAEWEELGLVKDSKEKGARYDFFRNRILFPFHDPRGDVIAFSGRRKQESDPKYAKYKNSQESPLFQKRAYLYGLRQNAKEIREAGALLVEGMADVVTAYDYGIRNAVATGGTALTTEHLRLLRGYTSRLVFLFDGDEAGLKATKKGVEMAYAAGFQCRVVLWDPPTEEDEKEGIEKYDPDNFLRRHGQEAFNQLIVDKAQDALVWLVMEYWDKDDRQRQEETINLAARLINGLQSTIQQDFYIRDLCKAKYLGRDVKSHLQQAIKELQKGEARKSRRTTNLTPEQEADVLRYGIYEKGNRYWVSPDPSMEGYAISNFIVRPIMLIVGSSKSERRVEIVNIYGIGFTINIDSDRFVEIASFRKEVERHGNYILLEYFKSEHFIKIKRKVYDDMQKCHPITTLGYHKRMGFFAWSNGIIAGGDFQPIDEHGIVIFENDRFYLPAFASVSDDILSDDQDNSYEDQKDFLYVEKPSAPSIEVWSRMMKEVHGDKGMMAVAWYLAAVFRDIIYEKLEFFPHLNCFGPPGTGKSFLAWSLSYMFGKARRPFNLHDGTAVGFYRRMAQVRNGIAWFDEYNNGIDHRRAQGLKNAYDGAGREKGVASTDNRTMTTKVNSALLITGQEIPAQDIALYTRCITMSFSQTSRSASQQDKAQELVKIQQTGALSQITSQLQAHRDFIADHFNQMFDEHRNELGDLTKSKDVSDRLISNYAVPLTVFYLLKQQLNFGFSYRELADFAYKNLIWQNESISEEDDLAQWWDTFDYYVSKNLLQHDTDFLVQKVRELTVRKPGGKYTDTERLSFEQDVKVLFIILNKAFRYYKEQSRKEGASSLSKDSIRYYLKHSPAFLGEIRAKKIGGQAKSCLAFDLGKMKLELPLSCEIESNDPDGAKD